MARDEQLILESVLPFTEVIHVHVAMLMDFFFPMFWGNKGHFRNECFRFKEDGVVVEAFWRGIPSVGNHRDADFRSDFFTGKFQCFDLGSIKVLEFRFEFISPLVNHKSNGVDGVSRW